jgi:hypothetical protein
MRHMNLADLEEDLQEEYYLLRGKALQQHFHLQILQYHPQDWVVLHHLHHHQLNLYH